MSKEELKACEHCRGKANARQGSRVTRMWTVVCRKCGLETKVYHTKLQAIKAWNHRQPDPRIKAMEDALEKAKKLSLTYETMANCFVAKLNKEPLINETVGEEYLAKLNALTKGDTDGK